MSKYDDIINLPHYELKYHPRMLPSKRAGQFAPFAALTGYDSDIKEAGRLTQRKINLTEDEISKIDIKLQYLETNKDEYFTIKYFIGDKYKLGGSYNSIHTKVKKINRHNSFILTDENIKIDFINIIEINLDNKLFDE